MKTQNLVIAGVVIAILVGVYALMPNNDEGEKTMKKEVMKQEKTMGNEEAMTQTIVDVAASEEDFSTLVTAVTEAGLVETLSGEGPFTVFAPTNAAFEKLPDGTLEAVLADKEQLTSILTYHVVPGKVMSGDLSDGMTVATVQGQEVTFSVGDDGVFVNGAQVTTADIETSNGVIHVIDTVILPE